MNFTDSGLNLIREFEGCKLEAYKDQRGIMTIGYGCTHHVAERQSITQEQATERLREDIQETVDSVRKIIFPRELTDNQFSACVSLAFNIGTGNFSKSTLLNCLKTNRDMDAASEFLKWNKTNGVENSGLLRRRQAERVLFES